MFPGRLSKIPRRASRLAARASILYFVIPAVAIVILLAIGTVISRNIADDFSRRLARQYSIEAAANFLISVNPHFVLMQQISRSTTIARWLANEDDMASKAIAFDEIMGYAAFLPDAYIMFTAYGTLQGYNFYTSLSLEEFLPWGQLAGGDVSRWFFNTRDAEMPFILNIQRTRPIDGQWRLYIWSNHRMYYQNHFVGVVTVGSPFAGIFDTTFGNFNVEHERGYIIDRNSAVRVDSAMQLKVLEDGLPTFPPLPEAAYNQSLFDHIKRHQQAKIGGLFQPGQPTLDAIPLTSGIYRYASITPIAGTDWSVVVLSNNLGLFGGIQYLPLFLSVIAVLVLSILAGNTLVHRTALVPLHKLTQSTAAAASITVKSNIFGLERDDEIGVLARTVQFMRTSLSSVNVELLENQRVIEQAQESLEYREKLLSTIKDAAEVLLTSTEEATMEALMKGMELLGRCVDADRVQIWRNEMINSELHFVMRYEWLSEIGKQKIEVPIGLSASYNSRPGWFEMFMNGKSMNGPLSSLPPEDAAFLGYYEMVSIVNMPLFLDNKLIGFFSIDDCQRERVFTEDEMKMFASAGLMFASVFNRNFQRDLALTDALTGVRNRRYLMEMTELELRNCIEKNIEFSVIMIDIDFFKSINDRYGHTCGDAVLKILTARIRHVLKQDTLLARYGGEEFVVTLPGVRHEDAISTAWRLQKTIEAYAFRIEDLEIAVTASFGVASKTPRCTTLVDIITRADKALYDAKHAGKNTVVGYTSQSSNSSSAQAAH